MRILVIVLSLSLVSCASVGRDKYLHAGGSTLIGGTANIVLNKPEHAFAACMAVGVAKELIDIQTTGFDHEDLIADGIGCLVGVAITELIKNIR